MPSQSDHRARSALIEENFEKISDYYENTGKNWLGQLLHCLATAVKYNSDESYTNEERKELMVGYHNFISNPDFTDCAARDEAFSACLGFAQMFGAYADNQNDRDATSLLFQPSTRRSLLEVIGTESGGSTEGSGSRRPRLTFKRKHSVEPTAAAADQAATPASSSSDNNSVQPRSLFANPPREEEKEKTSVQQPAAKAKEGEKKDGAEEEELTPPTTPPVDESTEAPADNDAAPRASSGADKVKPPAATGTLQKEKEAPGNANAATPASAAAEGASVQRATPATPSGSALKKEATTPANEDDETPAPPPAKRLSLAGTRRAEAAVATPHKEKAEESDDEQPTTSASGGLTRRQMRELKKLGKTPGWTGTTGVITSGKRSRRKVAVEREEEEENGEASASPEDASAEQREEESDQGAAMDAQPAPAAAAEAPSAEQGEVTQGVSQLSIGNRKMLLNPFGLEDESMDEDEEEDTENPCNNSMIEWTASFDQKTKCAHCEKVFDGFKRLSAHIYAHKNQLGFGGKVFQCLGCMKEFKSHGGARNHTVTAMRQNELGCKDRMAYVGVDQPLGIAPSTPSSAMRKNKEEEEANDEPPSTPLKARAGLQ